MTYTIKNDLKVVSALDKFKKDKILIKYRDENNPKELRVLSTSVNLE